MTDRNADRLAFRDGPHRWEGTLIVAVLLGLFAGIGMSAAAAPGAGDEDPAQATVVLNDGTEIAGTIVKETDDAVILRSAFGVTTIRRERIKEIRRGNSPLIEEFQERFEEAAARRRPAELLDLAEWAHRKGLEVEWRRTLDKVIEFDPDNTRARSELGHARLDGKWIEEREVEELLGQGYRLKGLELVKPEVGKTPSPKKADKPRKGSSAEKPKARKLSSAEKKKLEREREKRRKQQERYRRQRQLEYEGVAWRDRWQLKSSHYRIVCDSTEKVARTYMAIMEELHRVLSTRFKQRSLRSQKPTVTIYRNQQEFMNKTGMPKGVGGFYQPSSESVHAYHGTFGLTGTTFKVLAHEGTHQFQGKVLPNMRNFPKWIIEGMAVYYGDGSRLDHDKEKIVVGLVPRDRLFHIQEKMLQGTHTPLRSLVNLPGNKFGGSQYADSWSLLYYCFDGPKRAKGRRLIIEYWLRGMERKVSRKDFVDLAKKYFGSMEALEEDWIKHTLSLVPEPAGKVVGDDFVSREFKFEVRLPSDRWRYYTEGLKASDLIGMEIPDAAARVRIRLINKSDPEQSAKAYVNELLVPAREKKYDDVKMKSIKIADRDAFQLTYIDPDEDEDEEKDEAKDGSGGKQAGKKKSGKEEGKEDEEGDPPIRKRYREVLLVGIDKAYSIIGECPVETFESHKGDFAEVTRQFQIILGNRW